jgi:hypothetical protein
MRTMPNAFTQCVRTLFLTALMAAALHPGAQGEPVPVRHVAGTVHGFLTQRGEDGRVVAWGDSVQVAHGSQVTTHTLFTFKDGSKDEETTVFSVHRTFRLISDHHVQNGPSFPHPMDLSVDAHSGQVTVRTTGKDGKEESYSEHMNLPPDLANGMVPVVLENLGADAEATVSMVVATPKPRLVKLAISPRSEDDFSIFGAGGDSAHKALHYQIKIEIGGLAGMVAPLIGKEPPNIEVWTVGGEAPTFLKEQGPTYEDGPIMTIELSGPMWPDEHKSGE